MKRTIVLSPGHGLSKKKTWERPLLTLKNGSIILKNNFNQSPHDCEDDWYREDLGVLAITWEAKAYLEKMDYEVHLTRADERDTHQWVGNLYKLNQWKRDNWSETRYIKEMCSRVKSDIYVSIHTNAADSETANGCIGFWKSAAGCDLADEIVTQITKDLGVARRRSGLMKRGFGQFNGHSKGRCCLIECMFHTHPKELELLLDPEKIRDIGKAIAKGIDSYCVKHLK